MDVYKAADALGITPSTVRNQLEKGVIRGAKLGRFWDISPEEVERYREDHKGKHTGSVEALRRIHADPVLTAKRRAALAAPDVKERMRQSKLGVAQSPEHVAKRVAPRIGRPLSDAHREALRAAQAGRALAPEHVVKLKAAANRPEVRAAKSVRERSRRTPAQIAALASWNAKSRGPMSPEHRDKISQGQVRAYLEGRRKYNAWEVRAADMLLPLGYERFPRLGGHAFDFGNAITLVEVNSCRYHDHRAIKPTCPTTPKPGSLEADERARSIARSAGMRLIELWSCETRRWAKLIGIPAQRP